MRIALIQHTWSAEDESKMSVVLKHYQKCCMACKLVMSITPLAVVSLPLLYQDLAACRKFVFLSITLSAKLSSEDRPIEHNLCSKKRGA